jgi:hypothetical protein
VALVTQDVTNACLDGAVVSDAESSRGVVEDCALVPVEIRHRRAAAVGATVRLWRLSLRRL